MTFDGNQIGCALVPSKCDCPEEKLSLQGLLHPEMNHLRGCNRGTNKNGSCDVRYYIYIAQNPLNQINTD